MDAPKKTSRVWTRASLRAVVCGGAALVALGAWLGTRKTSQKPADFAPTEIASAAKSSPDAGSVANGDDLGDGADPVFRRPSGDVPALTCDEARSIVTQVGEELAFDPPDVRAPAFASSVSDWVDPHGFWAASSSSPPYAAITKNSQALASEILAEKGECAAARDVGKSLAHWIDDLRRTYDARLEHPTATSLEAAASDPILDDATTTHAEESTVELLADRLAELHAALGPDADPILKAARDRYFPEFGPDAWSRVVLAAAVRAYVPLVDPHGAWAPLDEEASVYEIDLDANPPVPLWEKVLRTAAGARIESGALAPLKDGDVVVELDHMMIAGLSLEQVDQLGIVSAAARDPIEARVLREGETKLRTIRIEAAKPADDSAPEARDDLESHRVAYGDSDVGVVAIREVRDDLGEALARTVRSLGAGDRPLAGLVLDLRGNGGGSTEGAVTALSIFLPSAELFPMKRRDGSIETEATPGSVLGESYTGPLATLVDGSTASAAEMIAGALAAYHRAPTVGLRTYGKGCAQEYEDDDPRTGVLRLTTLLYALPDGTAVQRIGLAPMIRVPFAPLPGEDDTTESEAKLEGAPPTWKGPDMRTMEIVQKLDRANAMNWPPPAGAARSCDDADVCRALRALTSSALERADMTRGQKVSVPRAHR